MTPVADSPRMQPPIVWLVLAIAGCSTATDSGTAEAPEAIESRQSSSSDGPYFREAAGPDFVHETGAQGGYFFPEIMGGGAAFLDYDADGDLDIYLVNGVRPATANGTEGDRAANRLYRQETDGTFADVTEDCGLGDDGYGMGVAVGDVDNDGWPDVYVTNYGPDRLYVNQGDGTFRDVSRSAGIDNLRWAASACFADYDFDGRLDLFVTNYVDYHADRRCDDPAGRRDYCGPHVFGGTPDQLYRNVTGEGDNVSGSESFGAPVQFEDVSLRSGIARQSGPGLGVVCADFDNDDRPDFYVANDGQPNFLWINRGDGTFSDEAVLRGVATDALGRSQAGMGIAMGDVNNDLAADILLTHLDGEMNALYLSAGATFDEAAADSGVGAFGFSQTGFGTVLADIDLDGNLDLLVANGRVKRSVGAAHASLRQGVEQRESAVGNAWSAYEEPNHFFMGSSAGRFTPATAFDDDYLASRGVSRALVVGDVDDDGDLDVLVTNIGGRTVLYSNVAAKRGNWLTVRAIDPRIGCRDAYGAVLSAVAGERRWLRFLQPGFGYLSSQDARVHFGLGDATSLERIEVAWPDGVREVFPGGDVNRRRVLVRGRGTSP